MSRRDREPLVEFIVQALESAGCAIIHVPDARRAPFRLVFETPVGERIGIVAYAFLATSRRTRNRPEDEHRFQVKYGSRDGRLHEIWQDPFGLYTTMFLGIDLENGIFVAADPVLHNPTRFFISVELKQAHVQRVLETGWHAWERDRRAHAGGEVVEVLVGGTPRNLLRCVRLEQEALGEAPGHRHLIAERLSSAGDGALLPLFRRAGIEPARARAHALAEELALSEEEVLSLIQSAPRLKMAVRGWAAEEHLARMLRRVPGVSECRRIEVEGGADVILRYRGSPMVFVECKNVLRRRNGLGAIEN